MEVGETGRIEVPHEDLQFTYAEAEFEAMVGEPAEVGTTVHTMTGLLGEVVAVEDGTVTVDVDPGRSGQPVTSGDLRRRGA
jgi:FKBP-type peptidyl-prolyl cis-trans isomerase 2